MSMNKATCTRLLGHSHISGQERKEIQDKISTANPEQLKSIHRDLSSKAGSACPQHK